MKPAVFIGSSVEGLSIAHAVQQLLEHDADVTVWSQGVFELSHYPLDSLREALRNSDFGIFIFTPDDMVEMRNEKHSAVRDNVIFEMGMFVGLLGKEKNFIVMPKSQKDLHLPTDLVGLNPAVYDPVRRDGNLTAALGPACNAIRSAIQKRFAERDGSHADAEEIKALLVEFDCDAFKTPFHAERSLISFNRRVTEVKSSIEKRIGRIEPFYRRYLVEILTLVKSLEPLASVIETNDRFSHYTPTGSHGIAIDSVRFAILMRANELLWSLGYQGRIDGTQFVEEAIRISGYCRPEEIRKAEESLRRFGLSPSIVHDYTRLPEMVRADRDAIFDARRTRR